MGFVLRENYEVICLFNDKNCPILIDFPLANLTANRPLCLESNNIISVAQHGFRIGRPCLTNLLETLEDWSKPMDEGNQIDCVYLDLKKAFDRVPHKTLIKELEAYGIKGK